MQSTLLKVKVPFMARIGAYVPRAEGRIDQLNIFFTRRMHKAEAAVGVKSPRGSGERAPVHVQCEPKYNDEVAHQKLPINLR